MFINSSIHETGMILIETLHCIKTWQLDADIYSVFKKLRACI